MQIPKNKKRGFLQMCADRRFHSSVEKKFQETTGLSETDYWIEATAGGAAAACNFTTADYAFEHGAELMGWAAHGSSCGGFPGTSDQEMRKKLDKVVKERQKRYPKATHFRIFSTEDKLFIERVD